MLLYHYSSEKYSVLKTLERQGKVTEEDRKQPADCWYERPGRYFEHISFFFDPVPVDSIASYFPKDHPVWHSGCELFQYTVDSRRIGDFSFEVVEFPEKTKIYYDDSISTEEYYRLLILAIEKNGYIGQNNAALEKASMKFIRKTKENFKSILRRPNYNDIKYKYAATVPHVMLYPDSGEISYLSVQSVTVK